MKKTLATSVSISFAGLIRASGEEGGGTTTTTWSPDETTVMTTEGPATTTWNPDEPTVPYTSPTETTTWNPDETTSEGPAPQIEVVQKNNFPNNCNPVTDLGLPRGTEIIVPRVPDTANPGIAYINGLPEFPDLYATVYTPDTGTYVTWQLSITTERNERETLDNRRHAKCAIGSTWYIAPYFDNDWCGGDVTLVASFWVNGEPVSLTRTFKIRGKNPLDADAKAYVVSQSQALGKYSFAWAMVQHESRQHTGGTRKAYNHFNSVEGIPELPNFGPLDGWGLCMLDNPKGVRATAHEVYNWKENVDKFFLELAQKEEWQQNVLDAYAATFPTAPPPPNHTPAGTATVLTAIEAGTMQLYNEGAKIVRISGGKIVTSGGSLFPTAWTYSTDSGWVFHVNSDNYVWKVVSHEMEGGPEWTFVE